MQFAVFDFGCNVEIGDQPDVDQHFRFEIFLFVNPERGVSVYEAQFFIAILVA